MRKLLLLSALCLFLAGCATGSWGDRFWNAIVDRAPTTAEKIISNPNPVNAGISLVELILYGVGVASATGAGGAVAVKAVRKRRKKARLQTALDASAEIVVDAPLPLPPPTE